MPSGAEVKTALLLLALALPALADPVTDPRYCGPPARDADGRIARRADVLREFKRIHPCPSTGKATGACPGWAIDHTLPLACGGCDSVPNLAWMPNAIKSGPGRLPKDRWERRVYCRPLRITPMP